MSRIFRSRKALAFALAGSLAIVGAAVAYFTTSGSGTGTATVGTSSALTIHGTTTSTLYPGGTTPVSFTVDNASSGNQQLGTVHLASVVACDTALVAGACPSGHTIATCVSSETGASDTNTANFYMADVVSNQVFPAGNGQSVTATGTLKMNNLNSSQDSCKSANLLLNFTG
jgi:hypothetical protein